MGTGSEPVEIRELSRRTGDGIDVALMWNVRTNRVFVEVVDEGTSDSFRIRVDPSVALDAFYHPYAYQSGAASGADVDAAGLGAR
jgi:hypothetical protein